jgi:hypothetical protein
VPDNENPLVHVRVAVNVNSMRRGQELRLPLTEHVEALAMAGYVRILGHVDPPTQAAPASPPAPEPEPVPASPVAVAGGPIKPRRTRPKAVVKDDGGESPA